MFPAFPVHALPTILRFRQEAHISDFSSQKSEPHAAFHSQLNLIDDSGIELQNSTPFVIPFQAECEFQQVLLAAPSLSYMSVISNSPEINKLRLISLPNYLPGCQIPLLLACSHAWGRISVSASMASGVLRLDSPLTDASGTPVASTNQHWSAFRRRISTSSWIRFFPNRAVASYCAFNDAADFLGWAKFFSSGFVRDFYPYGDCLATGM